MAVRVVAGRLQPVLVRRRLKAWLAGLRPRTVGVLAGLVVGTAAAAAAAVLLVADRTDELE
ncbi:MAG: hypothetical protein AB7X49_16810, partial [Geminicoccaceae bacterium]